MNAFSLHPQLEKDTHLICELPLCSALLMNESQFPWVILVPRVPNISEIYELTEAEQAMLHKESTMVASRLMNHFKGEKMNTAALGNVVPQLHIHHVVRFSSDNAWPAPVWGNFTPQPFPDSVALAQKELLAALFHKIKA